MLNLSADACLKEETSAPRLAGHAQRKGLLQHTVDNEESALARLTFCENLLIGQETSVSCPHLRVSVLSGLSLEKM